MMNNSRKFFRCIQCLVGFLLAINSTQHTLAATDFKIITLQYRFAEEVLPVIKPLVGNEGTATAMQNNLIIRTTPQNMGEIEQIISTLDTPRQNLRITVSRNSTQSSERNSAEVSGRKRIGNVAVETGSRHTTIKDGVSVNIESQQSSSNASNNQFIQLLEGQRAFISVGQSIPYTQEWVTLTQRYANIRRTTEFINIDTGFAVQAKAIGKQIELEITPRFSQLTQSGMIDFDSLTTVVRANRGEWIDLGAIMQNKDDVSRAILSWQNRYQSLNTQLLIKVE